MYWKLSWKTLAASLSLAVASTALAAEEIRTVSDGHGRTVEVPANPQRVVSLHDIFLTVPLHELGVPIVGSYGRSDLRREGWAVRGFEPLFGVKASDAGITQVGSGSITFDIETVLALAPDLIIGNEFHVEDVESLRFAAPVILHRVHSGGTFGLDGTRALAALIGKEERLLELEQAYEAEVDTALAMLPPVSDARTSLVLVISGDQVFAMNGPGGFMEALDDLGFVQPDWLAEAAQELAPLSPEVLVGVDVNLLAVIEPGNIDRGSIRQTLDRVAPGWDLGMDQADILVIDEETMMTTAFASAHASIDAILSHYANRQ